VFIPSCPTLFSHSLIPLVSTFSFRYFTQVRPLDIGYLTTEHAQVMKTSCPMVMSKTSSIIFGKGGSRSKICLFNYIHKRGENLLWDFTSLYLVCTTGWAPAGKCIGYCWKLASPISIFSVSGGNLEMEACWTTRVRKGMT
jgi:hypothetical protein